MINTLHAIVFFLSILRVQQSGNIKISADELEELQLNGVTIIDIRTEREFLAGHIPDVNLHINYLQNDFLDKMKMMGTDNPIVVYCASGGRSGRASEVLVNAGFKLVYDYQAGFNDWKKSGRKVEK